MAASSRLKELISDLTTRVRKFIILEEVTASDVDSRNHMVEIAENLILRESAVSDGDPNLPAASRVFEELRRALSTIIGIQGFRVLSQRALTLASKKVPGLSRVMVTPDASLAGFSELNAEEITAAGVALIAQLLGLLATFIGEGLTLRIISGVWPGRAFNNTSDSGENI